MSEQIVPQLTPMIGKRNLTVRTNTQTFIVPTTMKFLRKAGKRFSEPDNLKINISATVRAGKVAKIPPSVGPA